MFQARKQSCCVSSALRAPGLDANLDGRAFTYQELLGGSAPRPRVNQLVGREASARKSARRRGRWSPTAWRRPVASAPRATPPGSIQVTTRPFFLVVGYRSPLRMSHSPAFVPARAGPRAPALDPGAHQSSDCGQPQVPARADYGWLRCPTSRRDALLAVADARSQDARSRRTGDRK
jgi:hypothetical protein